MRFSTVGIVSVATILITGINNTWVLAGSIRAMTTTDYGYLLVLKIGLFLLMLAVAAVNRLVLTPRLVRQHSPTTTLHVVGQLRRNVLIEVIVGTAILLIVAVLGTMSPETEEDDMGPHATVVLQQRA